MKSCNWGDLEFWTQLGARNRDSDLNRPFKNWPGNFGGQVYADRIRIWDESDVKFVLKQTPKALLEEVWELALESVNEDVCAEEDADADDDTDTDYDFEDDCEERESEY